MSDLIPPSPAPGGEILLYQTEDGRTRIQCRFENETIWLTQAQIAELFQTTPQNVTLHLKAIFAEGELVEMATCKDYLQVRREGGREVSRDLRHYRLEAILAVGSNAAMPNGRCRPSAFGIYTLREGCARYAPRCTRPWRSVSRFSRPSSYSPHFRPSTPAAAFRFKA